MHAKFEEPIYTHNEAAQTGFCQHCCTQLAQPKCKSLVYAQDALFLVAQITKTLAEYGLSFLYAIFVILAAICPRAIGYDNRQVRRQFELRESVSKIEECHRVDEINAAVEKLENGIGDPQRLKQMRMELNQFRSFEYARSEQLHELQSLIENREREFSSLTKRAIEEEERGGAYEAQRLRDWAHDARCEIDILKRKMNSI